MYKWADEPGGIVTYLVGNILRFLMPEDSAYSLWSHDKVIGDVFKNLDFRDMS
jgi:hypothetical protein